MSIYTSDRARACLLVDWRSVLHGLRVRGSAGASLNSTTTAAEVLGSLREAVAAVPQPSATETLVDTLLFGGFTSSDGGPTPELLTLHETLPRVNWAGIANSRYHLRAISTIRGFRPERPNDITPGLFRPDAPVRDAHLLFSSGKSCACRWATLTHRWLDRHENGKRYCPQCLADGEEVEVRLVRDQQKLVDVLLASFAFEIGRRYTLSDDDEGSGQIWICSADADFVPVLATIRRWGLRTIWLQPNMNRRFGYRKALEEIGIEVYDLPSLLTPREE